MKKLVLVMLALLLCLASYVAWQLFENNRGVEAVTEAEVQTSFDSAVGWLRDHQDQLLGVDNPILFWMVKEAWRNTGDVELGAFYQEFLARMQERKGLGLWTAYFDDDYQAPKLDTSLVDGWHDYQWFLAYSLVCAREIELDPIIQAQLQPDYCGMHFLHPRCVTHQMMGLMFMQRSNCGDAGQVAATLSALQDKAVAELSWDFRVTDAYIQRVTMLYATGEGERVEPVWLRRVLQAQDASGGWGDFFPIIPLPGGKAIGSSSTKPLIGRPHSTFHATAQGLWLTSLWLREAR